MNIGIVGLGYWGPNLVRNFLAAQGVSKVVCFDLDSSRMAKVRKLYPSVETTSSFEDLRDRKDVDAIALATPVSTHYSLGKEILEAGKHLMVEKPLATKASHAEKLLELADQKGLALMVDHTFIYTGAVRKMKEIMDAGDLGAPMYFDSVRVNLGLFQHDTSVVWDLATHDVSILEYLISKRPSAVSAVGVSHYNGVEDVVYITVHYDDNFLAHFHVNWLSPVKVRKILVGGTKRMLVYDDMEPSEKVKVYNKGVEVRETEELHKVLVQYRTGDMYAPNLDGGEALSGLAAEFVDCVETGRRPLTDGVAGLGVVRILEAAEQSIRSGGAVVEIRS